MSVVRNKPDRSNRAALSSPYARPAKKLSWSFSAFLNAINPLRHREVKEEEESLSSDEDVNVDGDAPETLPPPLLARKLSKGGQQLAENGVTNGHAFSGPPPPSARPGPSSAPPPVGLPSVDFTFQVSSSASRNLDTVTDFLTSHANQPIAAEDINQMVALIQQSKPGSSPSPSPTGPENRTNGIQSEEPFRFETRAATSPPRSKSPSVGPRASSAPRTLSRNPNGSYTWRGAGSARNHRSRNSYSAPAFGAPRPVAKRSSSSTEVSGNDGKRRKVGDHTQTLAAPSQSTITLTSQTNTATQSLKPPPTTVSVRQRTPGLSKPTTPVVPSPLRQAWTGGSPSGSEPGSPQGSALKQTETAKHVTELVKSLKTQDKVLEELRNPYELANPVKRSTAPKRKRVAKRKSAAPAKSKEEDTTRIKLKEMSAHDIIEATLPEGSKRSRPPPELEKATSVNKEPLGLSGDDEESEELPVPKQSKPQPNGHAIKEATDVDMHPPQAVTKDKKEKLPPIKVPVTAAPSSQPSGASKSLFGPKSSMPKEPSKLRFSMQPESNSTPPSPGSEQKAEVERVPKPSLSSGFTFTPPAAAPTTVILETDKKKETTPAKNFFATFAPPPPAPAPVPATVPTPAFVPTPAPPTTLKSARDAAKSQPLTSLPSFTFTFPVSSTTGTFKARDEVKAMPLASLPNFDLNKSVTTPASSSRAGFDWSTAGMKAPSAPSEGQWTCNTCMLQNPASALTKCQICEAPKPNVAPPKPAATFDWGAAGIKPATKRTDGEWICSQCALTNPASATAKCTVCEAPKPGAIAEPSKPTPTFDWGVAGLKPAAGPANGEWVCNECTLTNTASATTKCTICQAPKQGALATQTSGSTGFNWAAAGIKMPTATGVGEWICGTCGLQNPADAKSKCTICESARS